MVARLYFYIKIMNRIIKYIALITMMLCISIVTQAYDFQDGDCYYTITSLSEQTVALTNSGEIVSSDNWWDTQYVACYDGDFVVPQTAEYSGRKFKVTSIDGDAFKNCNLDKLTIPSTVISATLNGVIQKLVIEDSNIPLSHLSAYSVKNVYVGRNIDVPWNHLVYCFSHSSIEKIAFGDSVTYVPGGILEGCEELINVELSGGIKAILNGAFSGCTKLKTISGASVELLETKAFCDCISLESFDFPNLKTIDNGDSQWGTYRWGVFQGCTSLTNVILPQGLTSIGTMAFMDCTSLESIAIPASVVFIGDKYDIERSSVFTNCPLLKTITINGSEPINIGETTFDASTYINAILKIPVDTKNKYMTAMNWKNFFTIEEDANINDGIFSVIINGSGYYGYVEADGKEITNDNYIITANKGKSINLKFIPNSNEYGNYELGTVKVNGIDVTQNVIGNELIIEVTGNTTVDISWNYAKETPVFLSIKQADNGNVKLKVNKWNSCQFVFEPSEGWKIHSVSFNGKDVTNEITTDNSYWTPEITENSELVVVYASSESSIDEVQSGSSAKVIGYSGNITVKNVQIGEMISVYTTTGVLVNTTVANSNTTTIHVQDNEVYIVKVGMKTFKIGM